MYTQMETMPTDIKTVQSCFIVSRCWQLLLVTVTANNAFTVIKELSIVPGVVYLVISVI